MSVRIPNKCAGLVLLCGLTGLTACTSAPVVSTKPTPHTLIYTYLMAHGMARAAVMSGAVQPEALPQLLVADQAALHDVVLETLQPSDHQLKTAGQSVQQLLSLTEPPDAGKAKPRIR